MRITLAPLEGVIDYLMRELLTEMGGYDLCITEFLRVSDTLMPERSFYKLCPELHQGGLTNSGVPIRMQLLGQDGALLSEHANRAIELGSHGIDLNLGCPSKMVNTHRGGAVLLKEPEFIYQLVKDMRSNIASQHIFSVKIRLGWDDPNMVDEIADAIVQAGANELTIHARTKVDGYKSEAIKWPAINAVSNKHDIRIIANGEIWNKQDAQNCQKISGCDDLMIGRGPLAMPNLAAVIKGSQQPMTYVELLHLLVRYSRNEIAGNKCIYYPNRIKQWLNYLRRQYPQVIVLFSKVRTMKTTPEIVDTIAKELEHCFDVNI